jgi:arginyl-tRNA synthetase
VAIIRNRNNTTNYILRDVGGAIQCYEQFNFDEMIYVVMSEKDVHLQRLFKILELMGGPYEEMAKRVHHMIFGKVMGMSTREGNMKFLDDILGECDIAIHEVMQRNQVKYIKVEDPDRVADVLGISAVMVQDMKGKTG